MTGGILGFAILTTLDTLERKGLLTKDSPVKDLGLVLALLGNFLLDCKSLTRDVPTVSEDRKAPEQYWPYVIVRYAKSNGIEIAGVYEIEEKFVEKFGDAEKAGLLKGTERVDRWGWKTKVCSPFAVADVSVPRLHANHVKSGPSSSGPTIPKPPLANTTSSRWPQANAKRHLSVEGSRIPSILRILTMSLKPFQDAEKRLAEAAAKLR